MIFVGIQASGKSTFFRRRFFRTHVRINLDMLRTRQRERTLFRCCLEAGQSFVVDNTNPQPSDRRRYLPAARDAAFETIAYWFDVDVHHALERNRARAGAARIPDPGVRSTAGKLVPPSFAEGFDRIYRVRPAGDGGFEVAEVAMGDAPA